MESSSSSSAAKNNIHDHHHHQIHNNDHFLSVAAAGLTSHHHASWTPNSILSNVRFASSTDSDAEILNLRNPRLQNHHHDDNNNLVSSLPINPCTIMSNKDFDLDHQWDEGIHHHHQSNGHDEELRFSNHEIKQEGVPSLYQAAACYSSNYAKELREVDELNVKLLLKSLSSCGGGGESSININGGGGNNNNIVHSPSNLEECSSSLISSPRNNIKQSFCSQIYPTINVSQLLGQNVSMGDSSGFGMNLQALDLFNNSVGRFGSTLRPPPPQFQQHGGGGGGGGCFPNYGLDFMHQSGIECTLDSSGNMEIHNKRFEKHEESKVKAGSKTNVGNKRSRIESRACPPFKVRKEKLGDRIAALQQLVSPYGKTDTASVLMEAIGYIKFLQNQVETLSVPYLKSSRHKNNRPTVPHGGYGDNKTEERKQNLKSRGLCLVPVSCLSYVTDGNGAMWPL